MYVYMYSHTYIIHTFSYITPVSVFEYSATQNNEYLASVFCDD